jgi:hypothetical protein
MSSRPLSSSSRPSLTRPGPSHPVNHKPPSSLAASELSDLSPKVKEYIRTLERKNALLQETVDSFTLVNARSFSKEQREAMLGEQQREDPNDSFASTASAMNAMNVSTASTVLPGYSVSTVSSPPPPGGGDPRAPPSTDPYALQRERMLQYQNATLRSCLSKTSAQLNSALTIVDSVFTPPNKSTTDTGGVAVELQRTIIDVATTLNPSASAVPEDSPLYPMYTRVSAMIEEYRKRSSRLREEREEVEWRVGYEELRAREAPAFSASAAASEAPASGGKRRGKAVRPSELKGLRSLQDEYN